MSLLWLFVTEYPTYDSLLFITSPKYLQIPALPGRQNFPSGISKTVLSPLFVHLMHTNYYKIVKQLKSFKIIIVALTCFGLHKPSSGSSQPVLR